MVSVSTRIFVGVIAYLMMVQILIPATEECPRGHCLVQGAYTALARIGQLFPQNPYCNTVGSGGCGAAPTCLSNEYRNCRASIAQKPVFQGK